MNSNVKKAIMLSIIVLLFTIIYNRLLIKQLTSSASRRFSDYLVGQEYAVNRDGYIIKISDHVAIMTLYSEPDEVMYIHNTDGDGLQGETIIKHDVEDYIINSENITIIINDNEERQAIIIPK